MSLIKLRVVVPLYNEESVIQQFHDRVTQVLSSLQNVDWRIVYVLDRSTDETLNILRRIVATDNRSEVLSLSSRFGHQNSLLAGMKRSVDADAVVMMDGDLQHPPELIPQLLEKFEQGYDVVYTVREATQNIGYVRKSLGTLFYKLLGHLSRVPINSNAADFRLISATVNRSICQDFHERNVFLRGLFSWVGFNQCAVNFKAERRAAGESKYSFHRVLQLAASGILSFSTRPLRLGVIFGALFALTAFLLIAATVLSYFIGNSIPSGWTTIVVLLLFFNAIQLLVIGVLGVYIGAIYEEVKARPHYIVEEIISSHEQ